MCVNGKWIYNKYLRRSLFTDCGYCPSCLQQKANKRTQRIRNNVKDDEICIFMTLSYASQFVPYVRRSDLVSRVFPLPIYRDYKKLQYMSDGHLLERTERINEPVNYVDFIDDSYFVGFRGDQLSSLHGHNDLDAVGVIYYPDVQNFIKRLRQNLLRVYNFNQKFTYFIASEYGETYQRPHFHLLLFVPRGTFGLFRSAAVKSWQFAFGVERYLHCEVARDASSYVSSYVNCLSSIPKVFTCNSFRPKCSYSKGFGLALRAFSPSEVQKKVDRGCLKYSVFSTKERCGEVSDLLIPRYVINRYFPKFKGYFRFTSNQILELLQRPAQLRSFARYIDASAEEIERIITSLRNARDRYITLTGVSCVEYAFRFVSTWRVYDSTLYRIFMENQELLSDIDVLEQYDNIADLYFIKVHNSSLEVKLSLLSCDEMRTDPNTFGHRVRRTSTLSDLFYRKQKTRKINDFANEQDFIRPRVSSAVA